MLTFSENVKNNNKLVLKARVDNDFFSLYHSSNKIITLRM